MLTIEADVGHDVKRPNIVHAMLMTEFVAKVKMNRPKGDMERCHDFKHSMPNRANCLFFLVYR